jgi:hypothetical protein
MLHRSNKVYAEFFGLIHIWTVFSWALPMSGEKAENSSLLAGRTLAVGGKLLAIAGERSFGQSQGVAVGLDGAIGGPFGNGVSGTAFVFWKAAISHLPACFRRVSV